MRLTALFLLFTASFAQAAPPKVVTDIAPVHSLVAMVMGDIASPKLLLKGNTDPHSAALRPSQARALQEADLVIWIGPEMTPWLERAVTALPAAARELQLLHQSETHELEMRESDGHGHDTHGHDDHTPDPHAWLDPVNAQAWVHVIAGALSEADPENAPHYRANANTAAMDLGALERRIDAKMAIIRTTPFVVLHDAFQYFEARFSLTMAAALSPSDASRVGPASIKAFQNEAKEAGVACMLTEPGTAQSRIRALSKSTGLDVVEIDPLGRLIAPGPDQYFDTLTAIADAFAACLGTNS